MEGPARCEFLFHGSYLGGGVSLKICHSWSRLRYRRWPIPKWPYEEEKVILLLTFQLHDDSGDLGSRNLDFPFKRAAIERFQPFHSDDLQHPSRCLSAAKFIDLCIFALPPEINLKFSVVCCLMCAEFRWIWIHKQIDCAVRVSASSPPFLQEDHVFYEPWTPDRATIQTFQDIIFKRLHRFCNVSCAKTPVFKLKNVGFQAQKHRFCTIFSRILRLSLIYSFDSFYSEMFETSVSNRRSTIDASSDCF